MPKCSGCGCTLTIEELRTKYPRAISCCPERKMIFTGTEKLEAVRREIKWRKRVYPNRVETGRMPPHEADYQIKIMEAIAEDYEAMAKMERLL